MTMKKRRERKLLTLTLPCLVEPAMCRSSQYSYIRARARYAYIRARAL